RLYGFRWRDPMDWKSCAPNDVISASDVELGIGDAATDTFELIKPYGSGGHVWGRTIAKPITATLQVAIDGAPQILGVDYVFDAALAAVVFEAHAVPDIGAIVTAGFAFDVPVRFDADRLEISLSSFKAGSIPNIPIVEVRL
ncbi:MAG: TIGR02217 family protein, partial [Pseudomonadota bacterium]